MAVDLMQFGIAQWFFGNVYEAVVKIPERLAADTRRTSLFGAGSTWYRLNSLRIVAAGAALLAAQRARALTASAAPR
jgi:hypothetical protein